MHTKPYIKTLLITAVIFLSALSNQAQNHADTIRIVRDEVSTDFFYKNKYLTISQLTKIVADNRSAYRLMREAHSLYVASLVLSTTGGAIIGFSLGFFVVGKTILGESIPLDVFLPVLGAGTAVTVCGVVCELVANSKIQKGIQLYNKSIRNHNHTTLNLNFSPNKLTLKLNF